MSDVLAINGYLTGIADGSQPNVMHVCAIHVSKPMLNAVGVPIALQRLYPQPTQSQKPYIFVTSIPNSDTAAAKCLAMQPGSLFYLDNSHALAVPAFVIVSCIVNL